VEHRLPNVSPAALNRKSTPLGSKPSSMTNQPSALPTLWRVPDALWAQIAPTLVVNKPRQKPGRPRAADRPLSDALIHLARTGLQWSVLPPTFPPKSTVHDRLQEWVEYGCLEAAWARLLADDDNTLG
jgi:putative transposase